MGRLAIHPARGRRERNKARNRAAILAAAREVFGTSGFGAAYGAYLAYFRFVQEERILNDVTDRMLMRGSFDAVAERTVATGIEDLSEDLELERNAATLGGEDLVAAAMAGTGLATRASVLRAAGIKRRA